MNTFLSCLTHKAALVAAATLLSAGMTVSAAEPFPNGGVIEPNVEYTVGGSTDLLAKYIPTKTGKVSYRQCGCFGVYSSEETSMDNAIEPVGSSYIDGYLVMDIPVTENVPVYFYADSFDLMFANPGQLFKVIVDEPIELLGYSVEEGDVLSVTSGYDGFVVYFNQGVHASKATLSVDGTDTKVNIFMSTMDTPSLAVNYVSGLMDLLNNGVISGGEPLTITLSEISNGSGMLYNEGKDLEIKFKAPTKPVTVLNKQIPDPFLAYWKDGDQDAIVTIEYSGNISLADYQLLYGNFEAEVPDGYIEVGASNNPASLAKVTIDGNKVMINFAGTQRRPQDMVPSGTDYGEINLKISAYDETGQPVVGGGAGQVGSFDQQLTYLYVSPANFNVAFTPASGESLEGYENLTVHLYDYEKIQYSGVKFAIENGESYFVPRADIIETGGPEFDWTLTIAIPAEVQATNSKVTVTFEDMEFLDRDDHSAEFMAVYYGTGVSLNSDFFVLPAEGFVDELRSFEVGCDGFDTTLTENVDLQLSLISQADRVVLHTFSMADCTVSGSNVTFSLPETITNEGVYTLVIPEGFFNFSKDDNQEVSINAVRSVAYEIRGEAPAIEYTAVPAPGNVKTLGDEISVYFPNGPGIGSGDPQLIINGAAPIRLEATPEYPEDFSDPAMTLKVTLPKTYTAFGTYEFVFPNGYLLDMNGNAIGEVKLTYFLGAVGIEDITEGAASLDIYTLDGRRVVISGDADALKTLGTGLFIVNGKKVILK